MTSRARDSNRKWKEFDSLEVAIVFDAYPELIRTNLMHLRELIFNAAETTEGVGELEEALRWGEPSYLTTKSKSGSIIHLDSKDPTQYGIYVHCQTDLIARFKDIYPGQFNYDGNRGILFEKSDKVPDDKLSNFISMALTYHLDKKRRKSA